MPRWRREPPRDPDRLKDAEMWFMSWHPVAHGGGGREVACEGFEVATGALVDAFQRELDPHGIHQSPVGSHGCRGHETCATCLVIADVHAGDVTHHFLRGWCGLCAREIGRAHVLTPVTNAHFVCGL